MTCPLESRAALNAELPRGSRVLRWLLLLCVSLFASSPAAHAEYRRYKLFELLSLSDAIVTGTIRANSESMLELHVEEWLVGTGEADDLRIIPFRDWTCAGRWADYAVGQRVLVCLKRAAADESGSAPYQIIGGGGEGEMPWIESDVLLREYAVQGFAFLGHELDGEEVFGTRLSVESLRDAALGLRARIEWNIGPRESRENVEGDVRSLVTREELDAFAQTSRLARALVDEMRTADSFPREPLLRATKRAGSLRRIEGQKDKYDGPARAVRYTNGFGDACVHVGDVDGDGVTDLAVGAPRDNLGHEGHGAVWLLFMNANGSVRERREISGKTRDLPTCMQGAVGMGRSLAALGDLDGDGVPDLAVGGRECAGSAKRQGVVWIWMLARDGTIKSANDLGASPVMRQANLHGHGGFGTGLAAIGDLDGDGVVELAMRQNSSPLTRGEDLPSVFIAFLTAEGSVRRLTSLSGRDDFGLRSEDFGQAIAGAGDVNGDGVPDLALGDPYDSDGSGRGALWIAFLDRAGALIGKQKISDWQGNFGGVLHDKDRFGSSVGAAGDLNRDGTPDVLVGTGTRMWTLLLKPDGSVLRSLEADSPAGGFSDFWSLGRSFSVSRGAGSAPSQLVCGGSLGSGRKHTVLWVLEISPDGSVGSWDAP